MVFCSFFRTQINQLQGAKDLITTTKNLIPFGIIRFNSFQGEFTYEK